jgi:hypothetical protein
MRTPVRRTLAAFACLALATSAAFAQEAAAPPPSAVPPAAPPATPPGAPAAATPQPGQPVVVVLKDGQRLTGTLVSQGADGVTIESAGVRLPIPAASIQALALPGSEAAEGAWPRDPNRTRYLYSPSGFMLRQGEGYVSQTELILTTVGYGLTDWLTIQAGTVLPWVFFDPSTMPFVLALKAGGSPSEYVHLAAGFQAFTIPGVGTGTAGLLFGTVTVGTEDLHLGVSAGPPFAFGNGTSELGKVVVSISGNARISRSFALVSENWLVQVEGSTEVVGSAALRFIGERLGVDAGFVFAKGTTIPVPWLDFTWHFGKTGR